MCRDIKLGEFMNTTFCWRLLYKRNYKVMALTIFFTGMTFPYWVLYFKTNMLALKTINANCFIWVPIMWANLIWANLSALFFCSCSYDGWGFLKDCSLNDQSCFTFFPMLSFTWKKLRGVGSKNVNTIWHPNWTSFYVTESCGEIAV